MSQYTFRTSASAVTAAVEEVSRSRAPMVEFAPGPRLDAAIEAASLGFLDNIANGVFRMTDAGRELRQEKDPEGYVLNFVAIRSILKSRSAGEVDLLRLGL